MKKSDVLTVIGLVAGILLVGVSMASGEGGLMIFWDFGSICITIGGSLGAVLITYPMETVKKMGTLLGQAFKVEQNSTKEIIAQFADLSKKARREGLLSLEDEINQLDDKFLKKGLQMVVDGIEPETIKEILDLEITAMDERHSKGAALFTTWGGYAPGFGMLGTLIGLVIMLANMGGDPASIGPSMAVALITTFYGIILARLIFIPLATKISARNDVTMYKNTLQMEGLILLAERKSPRYIQDKVNSFVDVKEQFSIDRDLNNPSSN